MIDACSVRNYCTTGINHDIFSPECFYRLGTEIIETDIKNVFENAIQWCDTQKVPKSGTKTPESTVIVNDLISSIRKHRFSVLTAILSGMTALMTGMYIVIAVAIASIALSALFVPGMIALGGAVVLALSISCAIIQYRKVNHTLNLQEKRQAIINHYDIKNFKT